MAYCAGSETASSYDDVVPLFRDQSSLSDSRANVESLLVRSLIDKQVEARLKDLIEGAVMDVYVRTQFADFEVLENPFDPIYISDLQADPVTKQDIDKIICHSKIIDLSDTLSFNDEWDD